MDEPESLRLYITAALGARLKAITPTDSPLAPLTDLAVRRAAERAAKPTTREEARTLTAKKLFSWVPACESGRHVAHPGETCEEYEAYCEAASATWENAFGAILAARLTPMSQVPATLRGPRYPKPQADSAPLREVAAQALAQHHDDTITIQRTTTED